MVNKEVSAVSGNIVYLDKGNDHMYELNNKVRLIGFSAEHSHIVRCCYITFDIGI